jgi:hypothetical protein
MKKLSLIVLLLFLVALATTVYAIAISSESKTKGITTISCQYNDTVKFKTSAITTVTINGTGTGWPTVANTPEEWKVMPGMTSLVFTRTSSAAASPTIVYSIK